MTACPTVAGFCPDDSGVSSGDFPSDYNTSFGGVPESAWGPIGDTGFGFMANGGSSGGTVGGVSLPSLSGDSLVGAPSYNDFLWAEGQVNSNITIYTANESGFLTNRYGIEIPVFLGVVGGNVATNLGADAQGGDAPSWFEGIVDSRGVLLAKDGIRLEFAITDDFADAYRVVLFGNGAEAGMTNHLARVEIGGADDFINRTYDLSWESYIEPASVTAIDYGYNTLKGAIAVYDRIMPGDDRRFWITIYPDGTNDTYINAMCFEGIRFWTMNFFGAGETLHAYNDLSWATGQDDGYITTYSVGDSGPLYNRVTTNLSDVYVQIISDGVSSPESGAEPGEGTDAYKHFNGNVDALGYISGATNLTLIFTNLCPDLYYDIVLYGNAGNESLSNSPTTYEISGALHFLNYSPIESTIDGSADPQAVIDNGYNTENGMIARYAHITVGSNREFRISVSPSESDGTNMFYISAFRLSSEYMPQGADDDGDGLLDRFELFYFGGLGADPAGDDDNDGLSNQVEMKLGSNPNSNDTDGDGLTDAEEHFTYFTSVVNPDTDGDGLSDHYEMTHFYSPTWSYPFVVDTDGDGLSDQEEVEEIGTAPTHVDSDGDGIDDGYEVYMHESYPDLNPTDLSPTVADSDSDTDNDGLSNLYEYQVGWNPNNPAGVNYTYWAPNVLLVKDAGKETIRRGLGKNRNAFALGDCGDYSALLRCSPNTTREDAYPSYMWFSYTEGAGDKIMINGQPVGSMHNVIEVPSITTGVPVEFKITAVGDNVHGHAIGFWRTGVYTTGETNEYGDPLPHGIYIGNIASFYVPKMETARVWANDWLPTTNQPNGSVNISYGETNTLWLGIPVDTNSIRIWVNGYGSGEMYWLDMGSSAQGTASAASLNRLPTKHVLVKVTGAGADPETASLNRHDYTSAYRGGIELQKGSHVVDIGLDMSLDDILDEDEVTQTCLINIETIIPPPPPPPLPIKIDLDIDSDNNNGVNMPDRSSNEDTIEEAKDAGQYGKFIMVNQNDDDKDGIPDYADDDNAAEAQLVPLVVAIPVGIDWMSSKITFTFDGLNRFLTPEEWSGTTNIGNGFTDYRSAKKGSIRIWKEHVATAWRSRDEIFIEPGFQYDAIFLGFGNNAGTNIFYVEGINPAEKSAITVTLQVGSSFSCSDKVAVTVVNANLGVNCNNDLVNDNGLRTGIPDVKFNINENDDVIEDQRGIGGEFAYNWWFGRDEDLNTITELGLVDLSPFCVTVPQMLLDQGFKFYMQIGAGALHVYEAVSPSSDRREFLSDSQQGIGRDPIIPTAFSQINKSAGGILVAAGPALIPVNQMTNEFVFKSIGDGQLDTTVSLLMSEPNSNSKIEADSFVISMKKIDEFYPMWSVRNWEGDDYQYKIEKDNTGSYREQNTGQYALAEKISGKGFDANKKQCLVSIHGWRITQENAYKELGEGYIRLFWTGYRGNYVGFTWQGDQFLAPFNFAPNVKNAFQTASRFEEFIREKIRGDYQVDENNLYIWSHSLGTQVAVDAMRLHQVHDPGDVLANSLTIIESAVWSEAFDNPGDRVYSGVDPVTYTSEELRKYSWSYIFNQANAANPRDSVNYFIHSYNTNDWGLWYMIIDDKYVRNREKHYDRESPPNDRLPCFTTYFYPPGWPDVPETVTAYNLAHSIPALLKKDARREDYRIQDIEPVAGQKIIPNADAINARDFGWNIWSHNGHKGGADADMGRLINDPDVTFYEVLRYSITVPWRTDLDTPLPQIWSWFEVLQDKTSYQVGKE